MAAELGTVCAAALVVDRREGMVEEVFIGEKIVPGSGATAGFLLDTFRQTSAVCSRCRCVIEASRES